MPTFRHSLWLIFLGSIAAPAVSQESATRLPIAKPATAGMDAKKLNEIDQVVNAAIKNGNLPGAVVMVLHRGKIVFRKAYGSRSVQPQRHMMTFDVVFDLASLTKPIATATCIMLLVERGKLRLRDPVYRYLPEFNAGEQKKITIGHLLLHTSGLIPDNSLRDYRDGKDKAWQKLLQQKPLTDPGSKFRYSDVGFMLLGKIVEKVSGETLDVFAHKNIFAPLDMNDTTFNPAKDLARRAAPADKRNGQFIQGQVHDPRAFALGGVAGHAGLFSTADDLAVYCQMLMNGGQFGGRRILSPLTVRLFTKPQSIPGGKRSYGWDVDTGYSSNRGELFPVGGFGHTGFTGTSIWIDGQSQTAVIFLSNRVHPNGKGSVIRLRNQVATIVAASIADTSFGASVNTGIDVLKKNKFRQLKGRRVGLVTNHTGIDRDGNSTIDLLHSAKAVNLVALFSPEHGIRGQADKLVADDRDKKTGLPIYSLYGKRRRPSAEQLRGIDTLVFDIQDIGCRYYTYISTLGYLLETAAKHKIKVVVLDRPNPIGGIAVDGPVLEKRFESFVGYHPLPVRHSMTVGELALLFNKERRISADLEIIRMEGWRREMLFDKTGLFWVNPSPNMRSLTEALLYPGIGLLETTNISVGRGTDRPFEIIGAPWLDGQKLATALPKHKLPGIRFVPTRFTPKSSVHAGKPCGGLHLILDDWSKFSPLDTGITIAVELKRLYPKEWKSERYLRLLSHRPTLEAIESGQSPRDIRRLWQADLRQFREIRKRFLLY